MALGPHVTRCLFVSTNFCGSTATPIGLLPQQQGGVVVRESPRPRRTYSTPHLVPKRKSFPIPNTQQMWCQNIPSFFFFFTSLRFPRKVSHQHVVLMDWRPRRPWIKSWFYFLWSVWSHADIGWLSSQTPPQENWLQGVQLVGSFSAPHLWIRQHTVRKPRFLGLLPARNWLYVTGLMVPPRPCWTQESPKEHVPLGVTQWPGKFVPELGVVWALPSPSFPPSLLPQCPPAS